jgi:hypothetical protein
VIRAFKVTSAAVIALALTTGTAGAAAPTAAAAPAAPPSTVFTITDHLASQVAGDLADRAVRAHVASAVAAGTADLLTLQPGTALDQQAHVANGQVLTAKSLPAGSGSLLRLRLGNAGARTALADGAVPLVAAAPTDDTPTKVTAYDPSGGTVLLDPAKAPSRPVLVVDVDVAKALPMGLNVMRSKLAGRGIHPPQPVTKQAFKSQAAGGYWTTKINSVYLNDDEESWIEGDAEIYSIVGGFGLDGTPAVNIVQMPYLDNDGTTYYPNQILVSYLNYKYNLADVVMMEDDGDTNYSALATAIADALLTVLDQGTYTPLVNAILSAIPSSWWTNDPDYVDSWYTLGTTSSGRLNGARANGWMDVSPYWVSEL